MLNKAIAIAALTVTSFVGSAYATPNDPLPACVLPEEAPVDDAGISNVRENLSDIDVLCAIDPECDNGKTNAFTWPVPLVPGVLPARIIAD